jgi:hypothetical protein
MLDLRQQEISNDSVAQTRKQENTCCVVLEDSNSNVLISIPILVVCTSLFLLCTRDKVPVALSLRLLVQPNRAKVCCPPSMKHVAYAKLCSQCFNINPRLSRASISKQTNC